MSWTDDSDNLMMDLAFHYQDLHHPDYPVAFLGELAHELSTKFQALGIMILLGRAETDGFLHNLMRSVQTRVAYLQRMQQEGMDQDFFRAAGHYEPVLAGIAAADYGSVHLLATLSSPAVSPNEYPDDWCYAQILFRLAAVSPPASADYKPLVDEYRQALDGADCPRLDVACALITQDQDDFDQAFSEFLDEVEDGIDAAIERGQHETPIVFAERAVCIEGLAMLRLAIKHGLTTARNYEYCPSLARLPLRNPLPQLP